MAVNVNLGNTGLSVRLPSKLVRKKIPEIIIENGEYPWCVELTASANNVAEMNRLMALLAAKLVEEVDELVPELRLVPDTQTLMDKLVDVREVIISFLTLRSVGEEWLAKKACDSKIKEAGSEKEVCRASASDIEKLLYLKGLSKSMKARAEEILQQRDETALENVGYNLGALYYIYGALMDLCDYYEISFESLRKAGDKKRDKKGPFIVKRKENFVAYFLIATAKDESATRAETKAEEAE